MGHFEANVDLLGAVGDPDEGAETIQTTELPSPESLTYGLS